LLYCSISLPAFVFQLDMLDSDRIRVGIQVGQDFVFRNPTTIDLVSEHELSSLIVKLKNNVFAEVFQRNFRTTPRTEAPTLYCPSSRIPDRASVIAANSVCPGDLRLVLGSPPSRC